MDATAAAALEDNLRQLFAVIERLSWARRQLVPAKATFWDGMARQLYDRAVLLVEEDVDAALEILGYAQRNTMTAIAEVGGSV